MDLSGGIESMSTIDRGAASQHPPKLKSLKPGKMSWKTDWKRNKLVYLLFLPVFVYFLIVHYLPMFGIVMAFQNFRLARGILTALGSDLKIFQSCFLVTLFRTRFATQSSCRFSI